jgi:hypothetical protein
VLSAARQNESLNNQDNAQGYKSGGLIDQSLDNLSPSKVMRPLKMQFHHKNISEVVVLQ